MTYSTSSILEKLAVEKEENSLISTELFNETIAWIDIFTSYPEIRFDLVGNFEYFLPLLDQNKPNIEKTVASHLKNVLRKRGRTPKPPELKRSQHICVYLSDAEMAELAHLAGTQVPEKKRGGDTSCHRKIASYLRDSGLKNLQSPSSPQKQMIRLLGG